MLAQARPLEFYRRGVLVLGFGFFGVFGGFQAAQAMQTSVNATLGFINLAALYGTFTVLCLVAPPLLNALENTVGLRLVMVCSGLAYAAMALSNIYTKHWALPITMNVLVGVAAPLLWTCQNDLLGRCAYHAAKVAPDSIASDRDPQCGDEAGTAAAGDSDDKLKSMTASFNGLFFSIYQFAGGAGNILASVIMTVFSGKEWLKTVLFVVLAVASSTGAVIFMLLPVVGRSDTGTDELPSLQDTAKLAFGDYRVTLLVPLIFTNGLLLASVLGDYATDIICPVAGATFVGFTVAIFFAVNSIACVCWGALVSRKLISRFTAFMISTLLQLSYLVVRICWQRPDNYVKEDGDWTRKHSTEWFDVLIVFALVFVFATGDAFWESGPPATLQNCFMGSTQAVPAMANLKLWQSLGFAVQFLLGTFVGPTVRVGILIAMTCLSMASLALLNRLDPLK